MGNHFHLLIRERDERVGETIKRIASSYVYYYNRKYGRDGHLFKERFKSEPVRSALPLATAGTQERYGLFHSIVAVGFSGETVTCPPVLPAIHAQKTEISGEMKCGGQEAPDHPEQSCDGKINYTIKIIYK